MVLFAMNKDGFFLRGDRSTTNETDRLSEDRPPTICLGKKIAPSFEAIAQLATRPIAWENPKPNWPQLKSASIGKRPRRAPSSEMSEQSALTGWKKWPFSSRHLVTQAPRLTVKLSPNKTGPKLKSGPIADEEDGPFLRGDRSLNTALGEKEWPLRSGRSVNCPQPISGLNDQPQCPLTQKRSYCR